MAFDVRCEERADRDYLKPPLTRCLESEADQRRADALTLMRFRHFCVGEDDLARRKGVFGNSEAAVAEVGFEAVLLDIIADRISRDGAGNGARVAASLATC